MISILNRNLQRQFMLREGTSANRFEDYNGENGLTFESIIDEKLKISEDSILELNGDYFDIAYLKKEHGQAGKHTISVEAEHVSYRLNNEEYDMGAYTANNNPTAILNELLAGTEFSVGVVEYTSNIIFTSNEKKSRRQLLMIFVNALGGEVIFDKFKISIVQKRGSRDLQLYTPCKNVSVLSKTVDKRERDADGLPLTAYVCESISIKNHLFGIGDDVLLVGDAIGVKEKLRVVGYEYDPYKPFSTKYEISNFITDLEDDAYRMENSTVGKDSVYNGCRIGPTDGFVAEGLIKGRDDILSRTIMNATEGISIYSDSGEGLQRNFFVDLDGRIKGKGLDISGDATFEGQIKGGSIDIGNGNFTVDSRGYMKAYNANFEGAIKGSSITGGSIDIGKGNFVVDTEGNMIAYNAYFEGEIAGASTITVSTDATVGNWLNIGSITSSGGTKGINIYHGRNYASLDVDSGGDMRLLSWRDLNIYGDTISLNGNVILPYWSYIDYEEEDRRLATQGDLSDIREELDDLYRMIRDL